jgi:hypothetical protein
MDAFWIDREYDRDNASDGVSRYGAYIRQAAASFELYTDDDQDVELAIWAWQQATGPVMAPGYVRKHQRIATAHLNRSDWDGTLLATVDLVIPQPPNLRWMRSDEDRGMWRDWPVQRAFAGGDRFYEPDGDELARDPYLLTTASLRFTVPRGGLPQLSGSSVDVAKCREAVGVLVRELNAIVGPVLARVEEA